MNADPVCFGAKDDQFGRFDVEVGGYVEAVKLVHASGFLSCSPFLPAYNWGCEEEDDKLQILITAFNDTILLPESQEHFYVLPGYTVRSKEIVFTGLKNPLLLSSGQELRIWNGEDLLNEGDWDNGATTCTNVYAKYM